MIDRMRVNVYLDKELRNKALEKAKRMGLNFSAFVNMALYEYIKQDSAIQLVDIYKNLISEAKSGSVSD